ncbi:hypothetical protein PanWU01x14_243280 [Parasponia andersonii]|uniref:Uncharacterized protein n=1 Tax=Parasponia andersonii TaxID=3476 RepID=A0A2P5BFN1_PARAD|nr:hypothetical protein PanWU01x14_243280 [Parasponia andersonii]
MVQGKTMMSCIRKIAKQTLDSIPMISSGLTHELRQLSNNICNIKMSEAQVLETINNCSVFRRICQCSSGKYRKCWLIGKRSDDRFGPNHICTDEKIYDILPLREK